MTGDEELVENWQPGDQHIVVRGCDGRRRWAWVRKPGAQRAAFIPEPRPSLLGPWGPPSVEPGMARRLDRISQDLLGKKA